MNARRFLDCFFGCQSELLSHEAVSDGSRCVMPPCGMGTQADAAEIASVDQAKSHADTWRKNGRLSGTVVKQGTSIENTPQVARPSSVLPPSECPESGITLQAPSGASDSAGTRVGDPSQLSAAHHTHGAYCPPLTCSDAGRPNPLQHTVCRCGSCSRSEGVVTASEAATQPPQTQRPLPPTSQTAALPGARTSVTPAVAAVPATGPGYGRRSRNSDAGGVIDSASSGSMARMTHPGDLASDVACGDASVRSQLSGPTAGGGVAGTAAAGPFDVAAAGAAAPATAGCSDLSHEARPAVQAVLDVTALAMFNARSPLTAEDAVQLYQTANLPGAGASPVGACCDTDGRGHPHARCEPSTAPVGPCDPWTPAQRISHGLHSRRGAPPAAAGPGDIVTPTDLGCTSCGDALVGETRVEILRQFQGEVDTVLFTTFSVEMEHARALLAAGVSAPVLGDGCSAGAPENLPSLCSSPIDVADSPCCPPNPWVEVVEVGNVVVLDVASRCRPAREEGEEGLQRCGGVTQPMSWISGVIECVDVEKAADALLCGFVEEEDDAGCPGRASPFSTPGPVSAALAMRRRAPATAVQQPWRVEGRGYIKDSQCEDNCVSLEVVGELEAAAMPREPDSAAQRGQCGLLTLLSTMSGPGASALCGGPYNPTGRFKAPSGTRPGCVRPFRSPGGAVITPVAAAAAAAAGDLLAGCLPLQVATPWAEAQAAPAKSSAADGTPCSGSGSDRSGSEGLEAPVGAAGLPKEAKPHDSCGTPGVSYWDHSSCTALATGLSQVSNSSSGTRAVSAVTPCDGPGATCMRRALEALVARLQATTLRIGSASGLVVPPLDPRDLEDLSLGPIDSYAGSGVVQFRGSTPTGKPVSIKLTELPCHLHLPYNRASSPDTAAAAGPLPPCDNGSEDRLGGDGLPSCVDGEVTVRPRGSLTPVDLNRLFLHDSNGATCSQGGEHVLEQRQRQRARCDAGVTAAPAAPAAPAAAAASSDTSFTLAASTLLEMGLCLGSTLDIPRVAAAAAARVASAVAAGGAEAEAEAEAEMFRIVCLELLQGAAEIACLSALHHPNIVKVCCWSCGVCIDCTPPRPGASRLYGTGSSTSLSLRPARDEDYTAPEPGVVPAAATASSAAASASPENERFMASSSDVQGVQPAGRGGAAAAVSSPVCLVLVTDGDLGTLQMALARGLFGGGRYHPAGWMDWQAILVTLRDVACALEYLHGQGLVHRAVHTSAVQLCSAAGDPRGFVAKLAEFGLVTRSSAQPEGQAEGEGGLVGPMECIPPEAFKGAAPSAASDVYAFGSLMWRCAHRGARLCPPDAAGQAPAQVLSGARPTLGPHVPVEYRRLVEACWSSDPLRRPSAQQLVHYLTGLMMGTRVV